MSNATRGKLAESKLKSFLMNESNSAGVTFYRLPDARAGSFAPTLCDFFFIQRGALTLLECKSTLHAYRLSHGNLEIGQLARMRLWSLAGASAKILIYHENLNLWRGYGLEKFIDRSVGGSWDLRDTEPKTLKELLV